MFDSKRYAFKIEVTTRAVFKCERYGIGILLEPDYLEKNPFIPIMAVLGNFYNKVSIGYREKIDEFIEAYHLEMGKSISEIGEEKIIKIIDDFNDIVKIV